VLSYALIFVLQSCDFPGIQGLLFLFIPMVSLKVRKVKYLGQEQERKIARSNERRVKAKR
jgi:hypothetical protein